MSEINKIIKLSAPPLLWSSVERAFNDINYNFDTLFASLGSGSLIDFTNLGGSLKPRLNETYDLGSETQKWRQLYVSGVEGINIGDAQITSTGSAINLPAGSTIGGAVLDNEYFREIAVTGQPTLIADAGGDAVLTVNPGTGVSITTNATTDTINFTNTGIISASAGTGISVSGTNPLQIANTGIITASAGTGISVSGTNPLQITNTGVTRIEAGNGIIVDTNTATVTITNGSPASTLRCFEYINLGTGGIVRADNNFDTVNITGDEHIQINKVGSAASNNIEFTFNNHVDIIGSVFAEDSSIMVDSIDQKIYAAGGFTGNLAGNTTGYHTGDVTGSVFSDDSTLLVDGVNGILPIEKVAGITLTGGDSTGSDLIITTLTNPDRNNGCGIGIYPGTASGTATDVGSMVIAGGASEVNALDGGSVFIRGGSNISGGTGGTVNITGGYSDVSDFGEIKIGESNTLSVGIRNDNIIIGKEGGTTNVYGTLVFRNDVNFSFATNIIGFSGNVTGDLTGSVFADDSTLIIDGTEGTVNASSVTTGTITGSAGLVIAATGGIKITMTNVPANSTGADGDLAGMVAFDSTSIYYCIADWVSPGSANIWVKQDWGTTGAW